MTKSVLRLLTASAIAVTSLSAVAGGFQLTEQNASGLGNAYAGTSALVEDASIGFYNPAGLVALNGPQVSISSAVINSNNDVSYYSSFSNSLFIPGGAPPPVIGNTREDAGGWHAIPAGHIAWPMNIQNQRIAFGLGVTSPWGLTTDYTDNAMSRYLATHSRITTINIGPTIAWEPIPCFSIGAGFDAQYFDTNLRQQLSVGGGFRDGTFSHEGDDWGYGWNAGLMYRMPQWGTTAGIAYRSRINHDIEGDVSIEMPTLPVYGNLSTNGSFEGRITMPDMATLSLVQDIGPCWTVMASASWIHWSVIDTVNINYTGPITSQTSGNEISLDFDDSWRYAAAVNFRATECWKFRLGVMYDETPVKNEYTRTFSLPDDDRLWVGIGANYTINKMFNVDAGYSHLFALHKTMVTQTQANPTFGTATATGKVESSSNIFGLQLNVKFS